MTPLFGFLNLGTWEIIMILIAGVLLFGRRLPEVGRYLGKGIIEFKRGLKGVEEEIDVTATHATSAPEPPRPPQRIAPSTPKFEE
jgi:sec-independent protein translocase protein TatA